MSLFLNTALNPSAAVVALLDVTHNTSRLSFDYISSIYLCALFLQGLKLCFLLPFILNLLGIIKKLVKKMEQGYMTVKCLNAILKNRDFKEIVTEN